MDTAAHPDTMTCRSLASTHPVVDFPVAEVARTGVAGTAPTVTATEGVVVAATAAVMAVRAVRQDVAAATDGIASKTLSSAIAVMLNVS